MAHKLEMPVKPEELPRLADNDQLNRHFWSFSEAARENGASRVLAGIHFPTAVRAGLERGDEVGAWAFDNALRPVASAPLRASASR